MPPKDPIPYYREYQNRPEVKERTRRKYRDHVDYVASLKDNPCEDCNRRFPFYCMDFHHLNGDDKKVNISKMWSWSRKSVEIELKNVF